MNTTEESEVTGMSFKTWVQLIAGLIIVGIVTLVLILALPTIRAFAPFLGIVIVVTLVVCVPGSVIFAAWYLYDVRKDKRIHARRFAANANNVYSAYLDETNGRFIQAINGPQPEAVSAHYAPTIHNDPAALYKIMQLGMQQQQIAAPSTVDSTIVIPAEYDLMDVVRSFPLTSDNLFLGRTGDGRNITVNAETQLCHGAFNAVTGRGKTILIRGIETQLLKFGHEVVHADIKFALVDERGNDYKPIAKSILDQGNISGTSIPHLLLRADAIRSMIRWLANDEIERRLALYNQGYAHKLKVFYLFLEELAYLHNLYKKDGLADDLSKILVVGRSLGIKVFTSAQNFQAQNSGINTGSRENFESAWYLGGDNKSGASLLDIPEKELSTIITTNNINLGKGVLFFRNNTVAPDATVMRAGMASNNFVYHMLGKADNFRIPYELTTSVTETGSLKREALETLDDDNLTAFQEGRVINGNFPSHGSRKLVERREALPEMLPTSRNMGSETGSTSRFLPVADDKELPAERHDELFFWYRKNGNVNDALASMGIKNSRYRRHAKYLVDQSTNVRQA